MTEADGLLRGTFWVFKSDSLRDYMYRAQSLYSVMHRIFIELNACTAPMFIKS